mmetsp:Transcript_12867/g.19967  ORF Transcript_12867/g.19967 Transcript_12867/m.19967 type:complete len:445 (-) Transcript_12867:44-1378(-)|eukprot:CAMPEP_0195281224 /NCGR_PEP_ID=MMETSP0707-20130614/632_1 /TAXON_ID=33640 /ORGANISM="Asterionellopsis glacialis, Strain CCMP134" /LENGTH=444 /DNA_ID=CAMNT_0040340093 /DNA_START=109 /DNA_END=1440 /DNA_ORIENTATION=-
MLSQKRILSAILSFLLCLKNHDLVSAFTTTTSGITHHHTFYNRNVESSLLPFSSFTQQYQKASSASKNRQGAATVRAQRRRESTSLSLFMKTPSPLPYPVRVAVMGGGNFGLALATVCGRQGIPTTILVRSEAVVDSINGNHKHPTYSPDLCLPPSIRATTDPKTALSDATYIIHAVPCQYTRSFLNNVKDEIPAGTPILSVSKGIESTSLGFMNEILEDVLGDERPYAFLSGPSFAREIREGVATAVVIASEDLDLARDLANLLSDDRFRCFTSQDVPGVEIGGAVKNVIAIAAGMSDGLGLGTNAKSTLVTRGCGEMRRLGLFFGAYPSTIAGLSGAGDTFGTCFGPLSRNRKFGFELGQGKSMEEILASTTEVAEGVATAIALVNLIKAKFKGYRLDLKFPILFAVASILEGKTTPKDGLDGFMNMPMQMENFDERTFGGK